MTNEVKLIILSKIQNSLGQRNYMKSDITAQSRLVYTVDKDGNLTNDFLFDEKHHVSDAMKNLARKKLTELGISPDKIENYIKVMKSY